MSVPLSSNVLGSKGGKLNLSDFCFKKNSSGVKKGTPRFKAKRRSAEE